MEAITLTASAIAGLIFAEALKASGKSFGQEASEKIIKLISTIRNKFKKTNTEGLLTQVQEQPTEENKAIFQTFLEMEMKKDDPFADELRELLKQIQKSQTTSLEILTNIEEVEDIEAEDITMKAKSEGSVNQSIAKNIKKAKNIKLKGIHQNVE